MILGVRGVTEKAVSAADARTTHKQLGLVHIPDCNVVNVIMASKEFLNWTSVGRGLIKLGKEIGNGAESIVYEGSFGDERVAVKKMFRGNENEVNILSNLEHENIIRYKHTERVDTMIYIILELCPFNLEQYVKKQHTSVSDVPHSPVEVLRQIVEGVNYLHNGEMKSTVHRDLKPTNILFSYTIRDDKWTVKISDFGISKDMDPSKSSTKSKPRGSSGYMAPELLDSENGDKAVGIVRKETDIFSLGLIFSYTLSGGKHAFGNDKHTVDKKIRDDEPDVAGLDAGYQYAESLILSMLQKDWRERLTAVAIKAHYFFWTAAKKSNFIQEVSDYLQDKGKHQKLIDKLEEKCKEVVQGSNWREVIGGPENPEIKRVLEKRAPKNQKKDEQDQRAKKKETGVWEVLRQIRNWAHHYRDKITTEKLRQELGPLPDGLIKFFETKFPKLLPHTYEIMGTKKDEDAFRHFYDMRDQTTQVRDMGASSSVQREAPRPEYFGDSDEDLLCLDDDTKSGSEAAQQNAGVLKLRDYQLELAEQALAGHNSLIIAPTGSGKTAVANEIIRNHLQQENAKSILFFVSKTTLALQQYQFFSRFLRDQLKETGAAYLIGEISSIAPVGSVMKEMKLTVLTPQIFIDELRRTKSFVKFDDISMVIFDECHNAHKKHPYKVIMDMLLDLQNESGRSLPIQVIGMTASPGVGKAKDREQVLENLITLLANLNIMECPAVVKKNKEELAKWQNDIAESYIRVPVGSDTFSRKILKAIELVEARVESLGIFGSKADQVPYPPQDKTKQMYEHWVVKLIKHVQHQIYDNEPSKDSRARKAVTYAENLQMYYNLLYLKKHIPKAMDVLDRPTSSDQNSDEGRYLRKIIAELHKASIGAEVPMLEKLLGELEKQFAENKESRCIIFVPRKLIARELVKCIESQSALAELRPEYLTGANEQELAGGMTKKKQETSLEAFRTGKCKVLIATSVAEEGLDIRACNLVIMYNYVTNEVGRIQRAGRGRAENSRSILIAPCGSAQIEREKMNKICAKATLDAIEDLNELSANERLSRIRKVQRKQERERKMERDDEQQRLREAADWKILCGKCQAFITTADQLRQIKNQHKFVIDQEFRSRVFKKQFYGNQREVTPGVTGVGEFRCGDQKCRHYLGLEMQYKKKLYPSLTVKQLIFENKNGNRTTAKQWNKCRFEILKDMEGSDDEEEDVAVITAPEFASLQAKSLKKADEADEADELSEEDAKEKLLMFGQ